MYANATRGPGFNGGAIEVNPMDQATIDAREAIDHGKPMWLGDPQLARLTRVRFLSDPGFPYWDLSYAYGVTKDGTPVRVTFPVGQFPRRGLKRALVEMASELGVYAKGLHLIDDAVISTLY